MDLKAASLDLSIYLFLLLFAVFCAVPMLLIVMVSVTDEAAIIEYGYSLIPSKTSGAAYATVFRRGSSVLRSYVVTVLVTFVGTLLAVSITAMAAYTLANRHVKYRNGMAMFVFITMLFHSGLVPWYVMCRNLGLTNNVLALIIPSLLFNPFNLFLVRNFMKGVPDSLMDSAKIDGASDFRIAFAIFFPLSTPVLAAISLFYALGYWNDWFNAIMLVDNKRLYPLQYLLLKLRELQTLAELQMPSISSEVAIPGESLKMATAIVTIGPIVFFYPFLQRYFVKGLIIGSIKG